MKLRVTFALAVGVVIVHSWSALASSPFAKSYRAPEALNPWSTGFGIAPVGAGYLLNTVSAIPTNQLGVGVRSFVRLTEDGDIDWALALTEGETGVSTIKAHPTEPLVFAKIDGLATEKAWTVFGVFRGQDGAPIFETGVSVIVDQGVAGYLPDPNLNVDYLNDGRCAVLMDGSGAVVRVGIIDGTGQPQWQRAFTGINSAFSIAGRGLHSTFVEDPGRGFWLIVVGSQKISTQPNPPPINHAVTLNVLRLNRTGELVWARQVGGLQLAQVVPRLAPAIVALDRSLTISFTDLVLAEDAEPTPTDYHTYTLSIGPEGQFRWATRVRRTNLTPIAGPDSTTFYLYGAQFRTIAPLNDDGVILKCDLSTGDALGQMSVNLGTAEDLTVAGASNDGLFIKAQPYFVPSGPFLGAVDANLQAGLWQVGLDSTASSSLIYNPQTRSLIFAERPGGDARVDVVSLASNLKPAAADRLTGPTSDCPRLTNATVVLHSPNLTVEKLPLISSSLLVSVDNTRLPLEPTRRIEFRAISPRSEDLCISTNNPLPQLSVRSISAAGMITLHFAAQAARRYEILFTPVLTQPFTLLTTVLGNGQVIEYDVPPTSGQSGFYQVRAVLP